MDNFLARTEKALGKGLIKKIQSNKYCIVGCGGTGALFAELLVRTGAKHLTLIDGDKVSESNLNRVLSFTRCDIEKKKVAVLQSRLKKINPDITISAYSCMLREQDSSDTDGQKVRDAIHGSNIVIIAMDNNTSRIICENLCFDCNRIKTLSIGVRTDTEAGDAEYECTWMPKTPPGMKEKEGYGNGSYASIVVEATSVAFSMLLHHLKNPDSKKFRSYSRTYKNFIPIIESLKEKGSS